MKKMFLYFTVFVVTFFSVSLIINMNNDKKLGNNYQNEKLYGDKEDYVFSFDEKTIVNEKIVAFDNTNVDYIRYYVAEFSGNQYVSYSYYFLKNHKQYVDVYSEYVSNVVDYNYDQFMIKTIDEISYGTYDEFINNIQTLIEDNSIYLIY